MKIGKQFILEGVIPLKDVPREHINLRYRLAVSEAYKACHKAVRKAHAVRSRALRKLAPAKQLELFPKTPLTTP